jgi:HAD superfamily hydrolase (TIGR01509 family)
MMPIKVSGAVFDMDGTMLDTERPSRIAWKEVGARMGYTITDDTISRTVGVSEADVRRAYMDGMGADFPYDEVRANVKRFLDERSEREGIPLRPGLVVLLDMFAALGVPMAVATSTNRARALWKLEKTGLAKRFAAFACGDEITHGKPAPDIFLLACERLGVAPRECVGFEDSPAGLEGLRAAGIRSVFVKDLIEPPPEVLAGVWYRAADLAEAAALFG